MNSNWSLEGKVALVTGATQGIGFATVKELADLGATVFFVARTETAVIRAEKELSEIGYTVRGFAADVTNDSNRRQIVAELTKLGRLDVLVNNVGYSERKTLKMSDEDTVYQQLSVNFVGNLMLTKQLTELLGSSRSGSIINVTSVAGVAALPNRILYGSAKAALEMATKYLALELADQGIRVNSVAPWFTKTPLTEKVLQDPENLEKIIRQTPLGRVAEPEEIARAIAFLALDASSYITGSSLFVDGGITARV